MVLVAAEQGLEVEASLKQRTEKILMAIDITQNKIIFGMCTQLGLFVRVHFMQRGFLDASVGHYGTFKGQKCETKHLEDINTNLV